MTEVVESCVGAGDGVSGAGAGNVVSLVGEGSASDVSDVSDVELSSVMAEVDVSVFAGEGVEDAATLRNV